MLEANNSLVIGVITSVYGIKGWVKVKSYTEPTENFISYQNCYLKPVQQGVGSKANAVKPVEFEQVKAHGKGLVAKIAGIDDRNAAEALGRCEVLVEREALLELAEDEYYWHQLEGLKVYSNFTEDAEEGELKEPVLLGEVSYLLETGSNDVIVVKACVGSVDDKERLLPYRPEVIENVDLEASRIDSNWDPDF